MTGCRLCDSRGLLYLDPPYPLGLAYGQGLVNMGYLKGQEDGMVAVVEGKGMREN
jgi:hypothetical protein